MQAIISALGLAKSWLSTSSPRLVLLLVRVTIRPAARETMNAGTWLTRPSPMRQLGVERQAWKQAPAVLEHADVEAAEDVDEGDDDSGDGIAADEFAGTVHGSVEVGFVGDVGPALAGFGFVDGAGVEIGVDGHLLAGHGVQGESGGDFRDARGAFGDHDELNHEDDDEDDDADGERAVGDEIGEGVDRLRRRCSWRSWDRRRGRRR